MSDQWRWVYFYDNISIYSFKEYSAGQIVWFNQKKIPINGRQHLTSRMGWDDNNPNFWNVQFLDKPFFRNRIHRAIYGMLK